MVNEASTLGYCQWDIFILSYKCTLGFPSGSNGKESAYNARDLSLISGLGRLTEKGVATHSSILTWRITWTEEAGETQSMGSQSGK